MSTDQDSTSIRRDGRCARCGRRLRKVFILDGREYGPVCFRKLGGRIDVQKEIKKGAFDSEKLRSHKDAFYFQGLPGEKNLVVVLNKDSNVLGELDPRFDIRKHSPDGFAWGYGGSGPAQLALALVAFICESNGLNIEDDISDFPRMYQSLKADVIADIGRTGGFKVEVEFLISYLTSNFSRLQGDISFPFKK